MVRVPEHERLVLDNGATLILLPRREVPLLACQVLLRGGSAVDPPAPPGAASLVAALLEKGAGGRDAYAFAETVEGAGGSFGAVAGPEAIAVRSQFLARDQGLMLELLSDALRAPRLEEREFEHLRERQIEFIKALKDSEPAELIDAYGRAMLFAGHPYARPVHGSESSLAQVTHAHARHYYRAHFGADRLILVLAGLQDPGNVGTLIRSAEAFGASGVVLLPGTVNRWNAKAVRASAGSVFRLPAVSLRVEEMMAMLRERGVRLLAATADGDVALDETGLDGPVALVIGNEGAGVPEELLAAADARVAIACPGPVESLNAAIAGSVLLYEAARQRAGVTE